MKFNLENAEYFNKFLIKAQNAKNTFKNTAPGCPEWYTVLVSGIGEDFKEGVSIIDYGSGGGALAVFLENTLENFRYIGLEPKNSDNLLKYEKYNNLLKNQKIQLRFINKDIIEYCVKNFNYVILGSVFTHLGWSESCRILDSLKFIIKKGGKIVFSCFLGDKKLLHNRNHYPYRKKDGATYHIVHITLDMVQSYCKENSINYKISESWYESRENNPKVKHIIIVLYK